MGGTEPLPIPSYSLGPMRPLRGLQRYKALHHDIIQHPERPLTRALGWFSIRRGGYKTRTHTHTHTHTPLQATVLLASTIRLIR